MLETPHVALGVLIATKVHPALALPVALASHFALDMIPHWNPHSYTETQKYGRPTNKTLTIATLDVIAALALGFFIAGRFLPDYYKFFFVLLTAFVSVLPDLVKSPYFLLKVRGRLSDYVKFERSLQADSKNFYFGVATQLAVIVVSLLLI